MRATRERLRERRKRHRNRLQQPHPQTRDQQKDMVPTAPMARVHTVRPRAKSASSRVSTGLAAEGKPQGPGKTDPVGMDTGDSMPQASVVPAWGLFSFAAIPWVLLAILFLFEGVQFFRFSRETAGFLEAAEAALAVLGEREEDEVCCSRETELRETLAGGLLKIYSRNRFIWPFSTFFR